MEENTPNKTKGVSVLLHQEHILTTRQLGLALSQCTPCLFSEVLYHMASQLKDEDIHKLAKELSNKDTSKNVDLFVRQGYDNSIGNLFIKKLFKQLQYHEVFNEIQGKESQ